MIVFEVIIVVVLGGCLDVLKQKPEPKAALTDTGTSIKALPIKCTLQGSPCLPAFSLDGDFVIGGVFSFHYKVNTVNNDYTTTPELARCTGRLV